MKLSSITSKIDLKVVVSVAIGVAAFGAVLWAIKRLPSNAVTAPIKKAAEVAAG